ncbi:holo-[acyl-carrier-protein] synthase [bacterium]|nr:holo-[acyl-carrier-protein] synthase [bacterium]OIO90014.1 MAG: holo-[acyl-carrier-protein] synthase [Anaerolineae bacterium CG2_30_58_95]PIU91524.1 MAG: holo-[acyl-carrier-protein] synthase [Anaerolineae bacterium CG06_land_8_20_14_3_00_57_67]PIW20799.1 MAG: holo-[acyl-carrier-protein] synthase [Anaerolineae bacterium CG17_big_fil_post_rev_8_21_14_2_50_57_27]PJH75527.1 MAG: holo-[acyl-carrier-protein] synthase [Anaerolineae bacterium CG_4_9_14_0_8_um_filter_58_9]
MILRTGIDLTDIARIHAAIERHGERFLRRIFTSAELKYCAGKDESLAVRFAAKEAVSKALGTGIGPVSWQEIEIRGGEYEAPAIILHDRAERIAKELRLTTWSVSLSHSETHAIAVVVAVGHRD